MVSKCFCKIKRPAEFTCHRWDTERQKGKNKTMIGENFVIGSARHYTVWLYIKILLMCLNVLPGTMAWGHDQCCGSHLVTLKGGQENFQNCTLHKCYRYMIESLIPGPAYFSTFYDMKLLNVFFSEEMFALKSL